MSASSDHRRAAEPSLAAEAREREVDDSGAIEAGITRAVAAGQEESWLAENRPTLESSNAFVEQHGLPLERYRNF